MMMWSSSNSSGEMGIGSLIGFYAAAISVFGGVAFLAASAAPPLAALAVLGMAGAGMQGILVVGAGVAERCFRNVEVCGPPLPDTANDAISLTTAPSPAEAFNPSAAPPDPTALEQPVSISRPITFKTPAA
jgi:hypothetical protein